jgi:asparagine synthase (glutamine-hydrolysing)
MCGIAGFLGNHGLNSGRAGKILQNMSAALRARGPDAEGHWHDPVRQIYLGHRRLSIVDLSPAGNQPMTSRCERYTLIYNGEIYNHRELRTEINEGSAQITWDGHSDTETLLAGIQVWGLETTLRKCTGMFALALWDRKLSILSLARDRMGEKPLYYGWQNARGQRAFLFGSELKALVQHPAFEDRIDRNVVSQFFRFSYVPTPYSIYAGISKLEPGTILTVSLEKADPEVKPYWSLYDAARAAKSNPFQGSPEEAVDALEVLGLDCVGRQMVADVPVGAFLSGGIDSSTIVALMQKCSSIPVKTFTIGFADPSFNEAVQAKAVAKHLGTDHHELYIEPADARAVIPYLAHIYSEPFADASQIPTFLVSRLARQRVTVALSGDAGDELFGGYNRYVFAERLWGWLSRSPYRARTAAAKILTSLPPAVWDRLGGSLAPKFVRRFGDMVHKGSGALSARTLQELHLALASTGHHPLDWVTGAQEPSNRFASNLPRLAGASHLEMMMLLDSLTYLPDDILAKVDRAAMAVSLETRVPLLDHRMIEFSWRLPSAYKIRDGKSKWPLRQLLYRHVPKHLVERPKMGFSVPIGEWLRGPLRCWAGDLLNETHLRQEGFWEPGRVQIAFAEHLSGRKDNSAELWPVLMFQSWKNVSKDELPRVVTNGHSNEGRREFAWAYNPGRKN